MPPEQIDKHLKEILSQYKNSFTAKDYSEENDDHDILMDVFGITPSLKRENRQYWGRELGMCWQRLVCEVFRLNCDNYQPAIRSGDDEPCDCVIGTDAIDTKYRIGSGDSGTLKKFKQYGELLQSKGFQPVILIVRNDNLSAAITACKAGGWNIRVGKDTFSYIHDKSGFDLHTWLQTLAGTKEFFVSR